MSPSNFVAHLKEGGNTTPGIKKQTPRTEPLGHSEDLTYSLQIP